MATAVLLPLGISAQGTTEKVVVESPGTLVEMVSELDSSRIFSLTVEGALNAADLEYLGGSSGKITTVKQLDISGITLVESEEPYKSFVVSENNVLMGNNTAVFYISDTPRSETAVIDTPLGGQSSVTKIYNNNLSGLFAQTNFQKVTLPSTISSLGFAIFFKSDAIEEVISSSPIAEIEGYAFYEASSFTTPNLSEQLQKIGDYAFYGCPLTSISLPTTVSTIGDSAFERTNLSQVNLNNVSTIGDSCFSSCQLEGVLDISGLSEIPNNAFYANTLITAIQFSPNLRNIGNSAFEYLIKIESLELPEGLETIGESAFARCTELKDITFPSSLVNIGYYAFLATEWDLSQSGEDGVIYVGNIAYAYDYMSITSDKEILTFKEGTTGISSNFDLGSQYVNGGYVYPNEYIREIIFPSSLKRIETRDGYSNGTFYNLKNVEEITFNEGLEYIGPYAFAECPKLWIESFPSTLQYIGNYAFRECNGLTEISFPASLNYLGNNVFYKCSGLSKVKYLYDVEHVGESVFSYCDGLYSIQIGKDVTWIPKGFFYSTSVQKVNFESPELREVPLVLEEGCFESCSNLQSITLPPVDTIGVGCFHSCAALKEIIVDGDCRVIESQSNINSNTFESLIIKGRVNKISDNAFGRDGRWGFSTPIKQFVAQRCDTIGNGAFEENSNLISVEIAEGIGHVGEYAFNKCTSLTEFPFSDDVTFEIGSFARTGLKKVRIGEWCKSVPAEVFYDCPNLEAVEFVSTPEEVGDYAFYNCENLKSFDFGNIKRVGTEAFYNVGFSEQPELYLPDGFTEISRQAFYHTGLKKISLPNSLLNIPRGAFRGRGEAFNLEWRIDDSYEIDYSKENVLDSLSCANFLGKADFYVPEGINRINDLAFRFAEFETISLPSTLYYLEGTAFYHCIDMKKIYCHAFYPPTLTAVHNVDFHFGQFKGTVYVPVGSVDLYRNDSQWGRFNIEPMPVAVESVTLNVDEVKINVGEWLQFEATVLPEDATDKSIIWASSNPDIAYFIGDGLVYGCSAGYVAISATSSENPDIVAYAYVSVDDNGSVSFVGSDSFSVCVEGKDIIVESLYDVMITDINGKIVYNGKPGTIQNISSGIYIVISGSERVKIIVK